MRERRSEGGEGRGAERKGGAEREGRRVREMRGDG